ncbi:MAG: HAD-IA family hydrolase [Candidatus Lokiarchaeota archaeon]|nr:HAD-IA family hydrolase [Candidatus Lokiarchaeota archaeon]MBD3338647.1 HAD-IA family hydrolase [Candidatus Lokiarchaeota archaeon]
MNSESNLIKTIIIDLGGVYFTHGSNLAIEKIANIFNISDYRMIIDFFNDITGQPGNDLRLGLITMDEFESKFIKTFKIDVKYKKHIRNIWFSSYVPHYRMEEVLKQLKEYRLIIFSGNVKERIDYLNKRYNFLKYFNDALFSFDVQKNKGDQEFYEILLDYINCEPEQAIIIDDAKEVLKTAEHFGFNGIQYYYTEYLVDQFNHYNIKIEI